MDGLTQFMSLLFSEESGQLYGKHVESFKPEQAKCNCAGCDGCNFSENPGKPRFPVDPIAPAKLKHCEESQVLRVS